MLDSDALQDDVTRTRDGYFFLVHTFSSTLPEPPNETPEIRHQRMQAAIAAVAGLCPVGLAEARLAARYVAADDHASDCLRLVNQLHDDLPMQLKCRTQSIAMARQSESALRALMRLQAIRLKRDAKPETAAAAEWAEHIATKAMTAAQTAGATESETTANQYEEAAHARHLEEGELSDVQLYEAMYPERAALIRRHGGVPANVSFGPPEEDIVQALLAGRPRSNDSIYKTQSHRT